jgi:hypothetical protein
MAHVGLQAVDGQDHSLLPVRDPAQVLGIGGGQRAEFIVTVKQVGDGAFGNDHTATLEFVPDLRHAPVFRVAESADEGDDVEAEFMMGQGKMRFRFGTEGAVVTTALPIGAAADVKGKVDDIRQGGDGSEVVIIGPERGLAFRAMAGNGLERLGAGGSRSWSSTHR